MTEQGIKVLRGEVIKDNPVPSLDNLNPPKDKCNSYLDGWYSALEAVKNILENGVETNKVQPEEKPKPRTRARVDVW